MFDFDKAFKELDEDFDHIKAYVNRARGTWKEICELQNTVKALNCYWMVEATSATKTFGLTYCTSSVTGKKLYYWVDKKNATKFVDYKGVLEAYYAVIDEYKDFNVCIKRYEAKNKDNYILAFFDPNGNQKYIKSLRRKSCLATDDIKNAARFTKGDAIQAMKKMLRDDAEVSMVNFVKGYKPELFIVNLAKKEK